MTNSTQIIRRKKLRRKRRRALLRVAVLTGFLAVIAAGLRTAGDYLQISRLGREDGRIQAASTVTVKKPEERFSSQIQKDLKKSAGMSKNAEIIYENRDRYPETLLSAYLNNPEMEDFLAGYLDAGIPQSTATEGLTAQEQQQEFPLLLQWDKRWGYVSYGGRAFSVASPAAVTLPLSVKASGVTIKSWAAFSSTVISANISSTVSGTFPDFLSAAFSVASSSESVSVSVSVSVSCSVSVSVSVSGSRLSISSSVGISSTKSFKISCSDSLSGSGACFADASSACACFLLFFTAVFTVRANTHRSIKANRHISPVKSCLSLFLLLNKHTGPCAIPSF